MKALEPITIETIIQAPIRLVWDLWTSPKHIINWNFASEDWCCPSATNDLRSGGEFSWRMEAKDGSMGFDFSGTYQEVKDHEFLSIKLADNRAVLIQFMLEGDKVRIIESFEPEELNSSELQRTGWQSILDNFKKYVEQNIA